jgi:tRNA dimethylallyltransferase
VTQVAADSAGAGVGRGRGRDDQRGTRALLLGGWAPSGRASSVAAWRERVPSTPTAARSRASAVRPPYDPNRAGSEPELSVSPDAPHSGTALSASRSGVVGQTAGIQADTLEQVSEDVRVPLVVIAGPTGVGKTAVAVALARRVPIEVISADSRQVYRGMDAATGKPTPEVRRSVVHHLVDIVDPDDRYQAARFRHDAAATIDAIRARGRLPVVVGGTGLYIRALLRGLDPAPPANPAFRLELAALAAREGRPALHARLSTEAPAMARRLHPNDHVRVVRALEVVRAGATAPVQSRWQDSDGTYDVAYFGLTMDRVALARRLESRAAAFIADGLLKEVERLLAQGYDASLPALQSIGYREFVQVARGSLSPSEALRTMRRDTVRYAKRQWTWFAREPSVEWLDVEKTGGAEGVADAIAARLDSRGVIR